MDNSDRRYAAYRNRIIERHFLDGVMTDRELNEDILNSINLLAKYGYSKEFVQIITKEVYYSLNHNIPFDINDMIKVADFVVSILKCYGYDEEKIIEYFKEHKNIVFSSYTDFVRRLSILNHFGFLEDAIFYNYNILTNAFKVSYGIGNASFYAICSSTQFSSIAELKEVLERIPENRIKELKSMYPLDSEIRKQLDTELSKTLKKAKFKCDMENRKRKLQKDSAN